MEHPEIFLAMSTDLETTAVPRSDLPRPIPGRICRRPVGRLGVPLPYYAAVGARGLDLAGWSMEKVQAIVKDRRCALCGNPLTARLVIEGPAGQGWSAKYDPNGPQGARFTVVLTPLEAVRRETRFLPAHQDCANWWGRAGSKLPHEFGFVIPDTGKRIPDSFQDGAAREQASQPSTLNPQLLAVWTTRGVHVQGTPQNGVWVSLGDPETVTWWLDGRAATQSEAADGITADVMAVVAKLRKRKDREMIEALRAGMVALGRWLPRKQGDPQISPMDAEEDLRS